MILSDFEKSQLKAKGGKRGTFGSSRSQMKSTLDVPGPGMYSIDESQKRSGFGFGSSKRPSLGASKSAAMNPGPG